MRDRAGPNSEGRPSLHRTSAAGEILAQSTRAKTTRHRGPGALRVASKRVAKSFSRRLASVSCGPQVLTLVREQSGRHSSAGWYAPALSQATAQPEHAK